MIKTLKTSLLTLLGLFFLATPSLALASSLSLSPSSGTFNQSCDFNLDISVDPVGAQVAGTDVILLYDNSRVTATNIATTTMFPEYPGSNIDDQNGKVIISGIASSTQPVSAAGKMATVTFQVKSNAPAGATQIKFDFDSNNMTKTTDSNVIDQSSGTDTLSSVVNGNYTIGTGTCGTKVVTPGTGGVSGGVGGTISTPSATFIPQKSLPQGGTKEYTFTVAIVGGVLTILGILGLALL